MTSGNYESHAEYGTSILPFIVNSITSVYHSDYIHWHEGTELLYCISGSGHVIVDGSTFDFTPGKLITVNKNQLHDVTNDEVLCYDYIIIFDDFFKENGIDTDKHRFSTVIESADIGEMFSRMHRDFKNCETAVKIRLDATELIYNLMKYHSAEAFEFKSSAIQGIKTAIEYINRNYSKNISLKQIAEISNFSKYYFTKKFKEITGVTYIDFVGFVKCQRAAEMIRSGKSVSEACFAVGYNDPAYFSRVFKKFLGVPPSKYK